MVSALVFGRRLSWLRSAWVSKELIPVICRQTAAELLRVLAYPKFRLDRSDREALLDDYLPFAQVVKLADPRPALPLGCRDRDDLVFIELAVSAQVDFLVSGDRDIAVLRDAAPVPIISVDDLAARLRPSQSPVSSPARFTST